jgi:hypothetical protein
VSVRYRAHTVCGGVAVLGALSPNPHPVRGLACGAVSLGQAAALRADAPRELRTGASQSEETPLPSPTTLDVQ